jgi:hypothetical protein
MKHSTKRQNFWIVIMGLLLAMAIPAAASAQGRNRGQRRASNEGWQNRTTRLSNYDKKCLKFKNCHDASEGRLDGRGPRGERVSNIVRHRHRHADDNGFLNNRRDRQRRNNILRNRGQRIRQQ